MIEQRVPPPQKESAGQEQTFDQHRIRAEAEAIVLQGYSQASDARGLFSRCLPKLTEILPNYVRHFGNTKGFNSLLVLSDGMARDNALLATYLKASGITHDALLKASTGSELLLRVEIDINSQLGLYTNDTNVVPFTATDGTKFPLNVRNAVHLAKTEVDHIEARNGVPIFTDVEANSHTAIAIQDLTDSFGVTPSPKDVESILYIKEGRFPSGAHMSYTAKGIYIPINDRGTFTPPGSLMRYVRAYIHELQHTTQPRGLSVINELDAYTASLRFLQQVGADSARGIFYPDNHYTESMQTEAVESYAKVEAHIEEKFIEPLQSDNILDHFTDHNFRNIRRANLAAPLAA